MRSRVETVEVSWKRDVGGQVQQAGCLVVSVPRVEDAAWLYDVVTYLVRFWAHKLSWLVTSDRTSGLAFEGTTVRVVEPENGREP